MIYLGRAAGFVMGGVMIIFGFCVAMTGREIEFLALGVFGGGLVAVAWQNKLREEA